MSEHKATIDWKRETPSFAYETYNRDHDWSFDSGVTVRASANPAYLGSESCVDPEEAFVAALSSCHMLTFLSIAARKKLAVDSYHDEAVGVLEKDAEGRLAITRVALRPAIRFGGEGCPEPRNTGGSTTRPTTPASSPTRSRPRSSSSRRNDEPGRGIAGSMGPLG